MSSVAASAPPPAAADPQTAAAAAAAAAEEAAAASKITAVARGRKTRKALAQDAAVMDGAKQFVDGIITRLETEAAVDPAAAALVENAITELEEQEAAATKMQAVCRGRMARRAAAGDAAATAAAAPAPAEAAPEMTEDEAAMKMQAVARGRIVRKAQRGADKTKATEAPVEIEAGEDEEAAAVKMQAAARGRRDRARARARKERAAQREAAASAGSDLTPRLPSDGDRSSTDVESMSSSKPAAHRLQKLPKAGKPTAAESPRVTAHSLRPLKGAAPAVKLEDAATDCCPACASKDTLIANLRRQLDAARGPGPAPPAMGADGATGSRRTSAPVIVAAEREMELLRQENAELKKALADRDSAKARRRARRSSQDQTA